jgi:hypothetical protein
MHLSIVAALLIVLVLGGCVSVLNLNNTNSSEDSQPTIIKPNITMPSVQAINSTKLIGFLPPPQEGWINTTEVHDNMITYGNGSYSVATIIYTNIMNLGNVTNSTDVLNQTNTTSNETVEIGIIDSAYSSSPFVAWNNLKEFNNTHGYTLRTGIEGFSAIETYSTAADSYVLRVNLMDRVLVNLIGINSNRKNLYAYANAINYTGLIAMAMPSLPSVSV